MARKAATLSALGLLALSACTRHIDSDEQLPPAAPPPVLEQVSRVEVTLRLPIAELEQALDQALPRSEVIDERIRLRLPLVSDPRIHLHGNAQRTPLRLRAEPPLLAFSSEISGQGSAPVRWSLRGRIDGSLAPAVDTQYRIHSNLRSGVDVEQARLQLDHLPDVSLRSLLEDRYRAAQPRWIEQLDRRLNEKADLAARAGQLWRSAHGAVSLRDDVDLILLHRPSALFLANPVTTRDGDLLLGLGFEGLLQLAVGDRPIAPEAQPLPSPRIVDYLGNRFTLALPVAVNLRKLGEAMEDALDQGRLRWEKYSLKVKGVAAGSDGSKLVLRLRVEGGPLWRRTKATVFLRGEPYIDDAGHELRLRGLAYTLDTRDRLLQAADWLLSPDLIAELQRRAVLPLEPLEAQGREAAGELARSLATRSDGLAQIEVERVRVEALSLHPGYIAVRLLASGQVQAQVSPLLKR